MHHGNKLLIDLKIIQNNYKYLKSICNSEVACMAKADCYGFGTKKVVPALIDKGCRKFFVMSLKEGLLLREINREIEIFVLYGLFPGQEEEFIDSNLIPVINCIEQFEILEKSKINNYAVQVDTGLNRSGFQIKDIIKNCSKINNRPGLVLLISHLAVSEHKDEEYNEMQLEKFNAIRKMFPGIKSSFANSGGIFLGEKFHFDVVRPGAALFGITPTSDTRFYENIKSPLTYLSEIIQIFEIEPGESVGYGRSYTAKKRITVATIPVGYHEKLPRVLGNKWKIAIDNHLVDVIGKVSMNIVNIDVTAVPKNLLYIGKEVKLIGEKNTLDNMTSCGVFDYEYAANMSSIGLPDKLYIN